MKKLIRYGDVLFSTLSEITSLIVAGHDKRMIFRKVLDCALQVIDAETVHLLEVDGQTVSKYTMRPGEEMKTEIVDDAAVLVGWMVRETEADHFQPGRELGVDVPMLAHSLSGDVSRVIISAPLVAKKSMFGLLVAIHRDGGMYGPQDIRLLTLLANQTAIALENTVLYQQLEKEAVTDGLTGVFNYRHLISSLDNEIKRARRFKQVFTFVMLDVDNLKVHNDRNGHISGSQVLKEIASIIKKSCREIDLVSKYGGDEFAILLPQTRLPGASKVTQRILEGVRLHHFEGTRAETITCSAGVSAFPRDGQTTREIIDAADKALYQAKRSGKNAVVTTEGLVEEMA
jgi:diguanylate cyclase (GGDEF)-like protein